MSGRPINDDRELSILLGKRTYVGLPHYKCNTTERYVSHGGCVHCARLVASEGRDARKFLKQHEREAAAYIADQEAGLGDPDVNHGHIEDLDDADELVQGMVSEYDASIDDLM